MFFWLWYVDDLLIASLNHYYWEILMRSLLPVVSELLMQIQQIYIITWKLITAKNVLALSLYRLVAEIWKCIY